MCLRAVIADDHPLFVMGLEHGLRAAGVSVVGTACDGDEVIALAQAVRPDVAVLDVRMPRTSGIEACKALVDQALTRTVVMLTTWDDPGTVAQARASGARALLSKDIDPHTLAAVLRRLHAHPTETAFPSGVGVALTERETEVLTLLAQGRSRKQVASALRISPETVKDHTRSLYDKLDAHDRVTAVTSAVRAGLVALPPSGGDA